MTKRYTIEDNIAIVDNESIPPNGIYTKIFVAQDPVEAIKICKELNKQDQQIKETKDAFYEAHQQQQECLKEVLKLYDEKRELEFKLNTLKKAYLCRTCTFNNKEMRYLKSLRE